MGISIQPLAIDDVKLIEVRRFRDARGYFSETFSKSEFEREELDGDYVQDNESFSEKAGTVRGLHFQRTPSAQTKLIRVLRGRIFDVAVDLRPGSPTFRRHVCAELSEGNGRQLLVPKGFAHGFCTLVPNTMVLYKVDNPYVPHKEGGVHWMDPNLAIPWPVPERDAILSEKDQNLPSLHELLAEFA